MTYQDDATCHGPRTDWTWHRLSTWHPFCGKHSILYAMSIMAWIGLTSIMRAENTSRDATKATWQLVDNSASSSQVIDMNEHGQFVGIRDVPLAGIGLQSEPFVFVDGQARAVPTPAGFTNLMPEAISNNRCVVGYASRVISHPEGSLRGFVYRVTEDEIVVLPPLDGHHGCHAVDVNDEGTMVVGYSTGRDPATMLPCVWHWKQGEWRPKALTTLHQFNPFLLTSRVVISGDGQRIAACITVAENPESANPYISHLYEWAWTEDGQWHMQPRAEFGVRLGAINNHAVIVGSCQLDRQRRAFVAEPDRPLRILDLLEGDVKAEAMDVNNHGQVVGYSDDPPGPEGGPQAFTWSDGHLAPVEFPRSTAFSWAAAVNDSGQIAGFVERTVEDSETDKIVSFVLSLLPANAVAP